MPYKHIPSRIRKNFLTDKHRGEGGKENPEASTYLKPEDFVWKNRFVLFTAAQIIIQIWANAKRCNVVLSVHRGSSRVSAAANGFAKQQPSAANKPPVSSLLLHAILWAAGKLAAITSDSHYCCCLQKPLAAAGMGPGGAHTAELARNNTQGTDQTTAVQFPIHALIHTQPGEHLFGTIQGNLTCCLTGVEWTLHISEWFLI